MSAAIAGAKALSANKPADASKTFLIFKVRVPFFLPIFLLSLQTFEESVTAVSRDVPVLLQRNAGSCVSAKPQCTENGRGEVHAHTQ
ncbi:MULTISPECIES: hypothetical protein [Bradyrhizobium]|uniref:hypothetical protein n=1 Tax=Bradyrhizobium TaxID=374 RepID=UPI00138AF4CD|nr:hypothetical protein [Bradyrhizobium elkanii]WLA87360.1 hypothetical protein QNJ99_26965 [Bradyrhizobium elkanii]